MPFCQTKNTFRTFECLQLFWLQFGSLLTDIRPPLSSSLMCTSLNLLCFYKVYPCTLINMYVYRWQSCCSHVFLNFKHSKLLSLIGCRVAQCSLHTLWPPYRDLPEALQLLALHVSRSSALSCNQWFTCTLLPLTFSLPHSFVWTVNR